LKATGTSLTSWLSQHGGTAGYTSSVLTSTSHLASHYPANGLRLITVGSDLSQAFSSLLGQYLTHDHSSSGSFPARPVDHGALKNNFRNSTLPFVASAITNDHHPQYLIRDTAGATRDPFNNAMLDDLIMGSTTSGSNYANLTSESNKYFSSHRSSRIKYTRL